MLTVIRYQSNALALSLIAAAGTTLINASKFGLPSDVVLTERVVVAQGSEALDLEASAKRGDQLVDAAGRVLATLNALGEWEYAN